MDTGELVDIALGYAARGYAVLPLHTVIESKCSCGKSDCASPGKHPLNPHGVREATCDPEQIRAWWQQWPWANIGIATGQRSGLAVIDVDPRNGGLDHLAELNLPETLTAQTGGQGYHFYFRQRGPLPKGKLAPGIDMQADGGYVVAPPSLHLQGEYRWLVECEPVDLPASCRNGKAIPPGKPTIIEPDQRLWVVELLVRKCPQGQRNETLTRLAGYFRNLLPQSVTTALLKQWNRAHCEPPLSEHEVEQNVRHKYQRYTGMVETPRIYWTMADLLAAEFPDPPCVVDGLLPVGLNILAGRPKRGKSFMALQISGAIADGEQCLGKATQQGLVVYVALEDSEIRIQKRARRMGIKPSQNFLLRTQFPPLDNGGLPELVDLLEQLHPRLLVIDTLSRVLSSKTDQDAVGMMTDVLGTVQRLAHDHQAAILMIDHHKKSGMETASDVIDDVLGSTGKTAVADSIWGLYRRPGESYATLNVTGRDIEEQALNLVWDALRCQWKIGESQATRISEQRLDQVLHFIAEVEEADVKTVAQYLSVSYNTAKETLQEGRARGYLKEEFVHTSSRGAAKSIFRMTGKMRRDDGDQ